jgi:hypothetical protein
MRTLPNQGVPIKWRRNLPPWASQEVGAKTEPRYQIFGADPKHWIPTKRMPMSSVNAKILVGQPMATIQADPYIL